MHNRGVTTRQPMNSTKSFGVVALIGTDGSGLLSSQGSRHLLWGIPFTVAVSQCRPAIHHQTTTVVHENMTPLAESSGMGCCDAPGGRQDHYCCDGSGC